MLRGRAAFCSGDEDEVKQAKPPDSRTAISSEPCIGSPTVTVLVLTRNERHHLARLLESPGLRALESTTIVVDSFSTDGTQELGRQLGATVYEHEFKNHSDQIEWALENINIETGWILRLDADELIDSALADKLRYQFRHAPAHVSGIELNRRHIHEGRWIRNGGRYPLWILRAWRTGTAAPNGRVMDEQMSLQCGNTIKLTGLFEDRNIRGSFSFIEKHNRYATREAIAILTERRFGPEAAPSSRQAHRKLFLKRIFARVPYPIAALSYFMLRYLPQAGIADGREALDYHVLQAFWYRYLVGIRMRELRRILEIESVPEGYGRAEFAAWLAQIYEQNESIVGGLIG